LNDKLKSSKFGKKIFELRESSTGYLWKFVVYSGIDIGIHTTRFRPKEQNLSYCSETYRKFVGERVYTLDG
jgi:hypothetical protein